MCTNEVTLFLSSGAKVRMAGSINGVIFNISSGDEEASLTMSPRELEAFTLYLQGMQLQIRSDNLNPPL